MILYASLISLLPFCLAQDGFVIDPKNADNGGGGGHSIPFDLSSLTDNRAFGMSPGDANFDGLHSAFPAQFLPPSNLTFSGVNYDFPQYRNSGNDNVLAQGQVLKPNRGRYFSISMLAAAENSIATGFINVTYSDNTTVSNPIIVDPYKDWPYPYGPGLAWPYTLKNSSQDYIDYNRSMIYQSVTWLDASKELVSIQLPNVTSGASGDPGGNAEETRLHIFAVSLIPATDTGISLEVQYARSTQMWLEGTNKTQIIEAVINNVGEDWVLANNSVRVTINSPGLTTVQPGVINRLRPGDQARVQIGVINSNGTAAGTEGQATLMVSGAGVRASHTFNATYGIAPYEATYESIYSHESPGWYTSGKYGIFIHWGVYSVPGWGNSGENGMYQTPKLRTMLTTSQKHTLNGTGGDSTVALENLIRPGSTISTLTAQMWFTMTSFKTSQHPSSIPKNGLTSLRMLVHNTSCKFPSIMTDMQSLICLQTFPTERV
jgi:alpha-L-fucosidase